MINFNELLSNIKKPAFIRPFVLLMALVLFYFKGGSPLMLAFDFSDEHCIEKGTISLLVKDSHPLFKNGEYVYFKPFGPIYNPSKDVVVKQVGGIPGDHLVISRGQISINGVVIASGLSLAETVYLQPQSAFEKDVVIPDGQLFVMGTHPLSNDSRYWGLLPQHQVIGKAYPLL
jgi:conjugal transfer pilin signal peptidase TrbI